MAARSTQAIALPAILMILSEMDSFLVRLKFDSSVLTMPELRPDLKCTRLVLALVGMKMIPQTKAVMMVRVASDLNQME